MNNYNSYFPHDSNAKDDPKCVLLIEQLGMEGYGIYWMLVETLRDQPNYRYPIILIPALYIVKFQMSHRSYNKINFNNILYIIIYIQ